MGCPYLEIKSDGSHEYDYYCRSCGLKIGHTYDKKTVDELCRSGLYPYEDCNAYRHWGGLPAVSPDAEKTWGNRSDPSPSSSSGSSVHDRPRSSSGSSVHDRPRSSHSYDRETDDSSYEESTSYDSSPPSGTGTSLFWLFMILSPIIVILGILEGVGYLRHSGVLDRHNHPAVQQVDLQKVRPGSILTFGRYEQDLEKDGFEDIEWIVLKKEDDRMLLVSRYILDCQQFNIVDEPTTWETCSLRYWLNTSFYNAAFDASEKAMIQTARLDAENLGGHVCNATDNKVFLLSVGDVKQYFETDNDRDCHPTEYAKAQGVESKYKFYYASNYWLRSPSAYQETATLVFSTGEIHYGDAPVAHVANSKVGVRPAIWLLYVPAQNNTEPVPFYWDVPTDAQDESDGSVDAFVPVPAAPAGKRTNLVELAQNNLSVNYDGNNNSFTWEAGPVRDAYWNEFQDFIAFSVSEGHQPCPDITLDPGGEDRVLDAWFFAAGKSADRGVRGGNTDPEDKLGLRFYGDGKMLFDTGLICSIDGARELHLDLSGVKALRIELYAAEKAWGTPTRVYLTGVVRDQSDSSQLPERREPPRPDPVLLTELAERCVASNWRAPEGNISELSSGSVSDPSGKSYSGYLEFRMKNPGDPAPWYLLDLGGAYRQLDLTCFVADRHGSSRGPDEQLGLRIYADERLVYDTGLLNGDRAALQLHAGVNGAKVLKLEVYTAGSGSGSSRLYLVNGFLSK